jgi:hypothetical protein
LFNETGVLCRGLADAFSSLYFEITVLLHCEASMKNFRTALISTVAALAFIPAIANAQAWPTAAATGTNNLNNGNYTQTWSWNSLTSGVGLYLNYGENTSGNGQILFEVNSTGANSTSGVTTYAAEVVNGHSGTTSTNYALYGEANAGTANNYGVLGQVGNGSGTPNAGDTGVWGDAYGTTGATYGVKGTNASATGVGGYFTNSNGGYALVTGSGNVGIATSTPNTTLQVNGGLQITSTGWPSTGTGVTILWDGSETVMQSSNRAGGTTLEPLYFESSYTDIYSGNLGIANASPAYLLHDGSSSASGIVMELQNSSGACTYNPGASSVTVSCSSDMRLKKDIQDSDSALPWIDDMRIRDFTVKATGERRTGVIAQEMKDTHPDMVHKNAEGFYSVDEPNPWMLAGIACTVERCRSANSAVAGASGSR